MEELIESLSDGIERVRDHACCDTHLEKCEAKSTVLGVIALDKINQSSILSVVEAKAP